MTEQPDKEKDRQKPKSHTPQRNGSGLTKVSVNLTPRSVIALHVATALTEDNQTDVVNRAVQLYAYVCLLEKKGRLLFSDDPTTGVRERLVLL